MRRYLIFAAKLTEKKHDSAGDEREADYKSPLRYHRAGW
jgi:hypothetical protein